jgi:ATP-dependent Lon protease
LPRVPSKVLPLIAMRELVMFPRNHSSFIVGRPKSLAAFKAARGEVALFTQLDPAADDPKISELSDVGVVASISNAQDVTSGKRVIAEATRRVRIARVLRRKTYTAVKLADVAELSGHTEPKDLAEVRKLFLQLDQSVEIPAPGAEVLLEGTLVRLLAPERYWLSREDVQRRLFRSEMPVFLASDDPGALADAVAHRLPLKQGQKLGLLEERDKSVRLSMLKRILEQEIDNRSLERDLNERVRRATKAQHREIFMREQLKQVLQELGEGAPLALHNPIFKGRGFRLDQKLAFVLMPFSSAFRPIYDEIIKPALETQGMRSVRPDDIYGPQGYNRGHMAPHQ